MAGDLDADREPTVFLVEDDAEVANYLVDELESAGLITFAFLSGEDALQQAHKMANRSQAIDLALVDLRLPGIDGLETVRRLRTHKPGLAAFLMTGYSDVETATTAADLGVVGFVLKPFDDVPQLVSRIKRAGPPGHVAHPGAPLPAADQGAPRARPVALPQAGRRDRRLSRSRASTGRPADVRAGPAPEPGIRKILWRIRGLACRAA